MYQTTETTPQTAPRGKRARGDSETGGGQSEYERQRIENIKRNQELMENLGIGRCHLTAVLCSLLLRESSGLMPAPPCNAQHAAVRGRCAGHAPGKPTC